MNVVMMMMMIKVLVVVLAMLTYVQMNIYITDWDRPSACNTDSLPYCQLFGPCT